MGEEENFLKAIEKLRKVEKERNFDQTVDLIINLKEFDVRRYSFSLFIQLPYKIKDKKIAGFLEQDSKLVTTIKKEEFVKFKEKKDVKKLIRGYDFFIANAKLMPAIATSFGRALGPAGKMPNPQLGVLQSEDEKIIKVLIEKINSTVRLKVKEPSIKIAIGKESLKNDEIVKNAITAYHKILETLPKQKDNLRNVKIKFTMGKPATIEI